MFKVYLFIAFVAVAYAAPATNVLEFSANLPIKVDAAQARTWQCTACGVLYEVVMVAEDIASAPLTTALEGACAALGPAAPVCAALVPFVVGAVEQYGHKLKKDQLCKEIIHAC